MGWGLDVIERHGWQFVVVELEARFLAAARYGDILTIHTWIDDTGRARSSWRQSMTREHDELAHLKVTAAFTDLSGRPRRLPDEFARHLSGLGS